MAKLFVPSGAPVHDNCGDTFSPTQFGFCGFLLATFLGIIWPSLKVVDVNLNGSAACIATATIKTIAPAAITLRSSRCDNITVPPEEKISRSGIFFPAKHRENLSCKLDLIQSFRRRVKPLKSAGQIVISIIDRI